MAKIRVPDTPKNRLQLMAIRLRSVESFEEFVGYVSELIGRDLEKREYVWLRGVYHTYKFLGMHE